MSDEGTRTRDETTRKIILPGEAPVGTQWDREAPKGPPTPMERTVKPEFKRVYDWIKQVVVDESLVADLALERAIEIVQFNHDRGLVGSDYFGDMTGAGGMAPTRTNVVAISVPLAVEIYRQALVSISKREDELKRLVREANPHAPAGTP